MTIKTLKDLEAKLNKENGNLSGVYKITRKSDGRVYIGQSVCITDRIISHIKNIRATSDDEAKGIDAAIQRDGWEAFDYEVVVAAPELNAEQLWMLENVNIAKYDSCNNGFNKTKGNHVGKYDHADFVKKHVVHIDVIKHMRDHFRLDFSGKKVLLINLFDQKFVDKLKFDDCYVRYISKYTEDKDELNEYILEELKKVEGQHFDLIIAKIFVNGFVKFIKWFNNLNDSQKIVSVILRKPINKKIKDNIDNNTGIFANQNILLTGFRDEIIQDFIIDNGGHIPSTFTKNISLLIVPNKTMTNLKTKKAKELKIKIITKDDFKKLYKLNE